MLRDQAATFRAESERWQQEAGHWRTQADQQTGLAEHLAKLVDQQQQLSLPDRMKDLPAIEGAGGEQQAAAGTERKTGAFTALWNRLRRKS
jgi:hypothetical protein